MVFTFGLARLSLRWTRGRDALTELRRWLRSHFFTHGLGINRHLSVDDGAWVPTLGLFCSVLEHSRILYRLGLDELDQGVAPAWLDGREF